MPHVQESSAPIEEQIKAYLETATTGKGTPLSKTSKYMYRENMKTMMNRMNKTNFDFIVNEVPNMIDYFDQVDNSETGPKKYLARMRACNFYSAVVAILPIATAQDIYERIVVNDQYNQWLKAHPIIKTPGKVKDYGGTWESIVREISDKVKKSKNELHKLILSLYSDTPPRRSLDYTDMLISVPDDHTHNILIFKPDMKKFIFNEYKVAYKKGPQHILITSPPLISIIDDFLKNHPDQKYL